MNSKLPPPKPMDISAVLSKSRPKIDYVLPGLPVGAVASIIGPGGVGKSYFALQMAVAVATGQSWVDELLAMGGEAVQKRRPSRVVLILSEESQQMTALRMHDVIDHLAGTPAQRKAIVARLAENLSVYPLAGGPRLLLDGQADGTYGLDTLSNLADGARLVVLDPLRRFHTGEENSSLEMTHAVEACERIAHRRSCAFVVTHHANKLAGQTSTGEKSAASRGSTALTDGVRLQMNLSPVDDAAAKRSQKATTETARHIRFDVAKANYIADGPRGILMRTPAGILVPAPVQDAGGELPVPRLETARGARKSSPRSNV